MLRELLDDLTFERLRLPATVIFALAFVAFCLFWAAVSSKDHPDALVLSVTALCACAAVLTRVVAQ